MTAITSAGIGSGLDVESLITKLVANERTPITQLQKSADGLKTQLSAYGKLQSNMATLRDAASKLNNVDTWAANLTSSSDAASVTASAGGGTLPGSFAVAVSQLATSQTLVSSTAYASGSTSVGTGTITIELGSWNADETAFTAKPDKTAIDIPIGAGEDQLNQIRDKINAAKAGVVASVVSDTNGSRLVMRAADSGAENSFRVSVNGDAGLAALAYDPSAGITSMTEKLKAQNAKATLNGIEVESQSNTLKEAIDGISITLLKTTSADVNITVTQDKDSVKKVINDFVTAYNGVAQYIREQTKYDATNKTAGTLQGDNTLLGLQSQLRGIISGSTTLGGSLTRLSDIGIGLGSDGSLKVDGSKLDKATNNLDGLKQLFKGLDASDSSNDGLSQRLRRFADDVLGVDGRITARQAGIQASINDNSKRQSALEDRVSLTEKRLRAQYTALDQSMSKLNSLGNYVTQQLAKL